MPVIYFRVGFKYLQNQLIHIPGPDKFGQNHHLVSVIADQSQRETLWVGLDQGWKPVQITILLPLLRLDEYRAGLVIDIVQLEWAIAEQQPFVQSLAKRLQGDPAGPFPVASCSSISCPKSSQPSRRIFWTYSFYITKNLILKIS